MKKVILIFSLMLIPSFSFSDKTSPSSIQAAFTKMINNTAFKNSLVVAKIGAGFITMTAAAGFAGVRIANNRVEIAYGGVDKIPLRWELAVYGCAAFAGLTCAMHGVLDLRN